MSYKGTDIEDKAVKPVEMSKLDRRLKDTMSDAEALLAKSKAPDQASFEECLAALDRAQVAARQELFLVSSRGDAAACKAKSDLQNASNVIRGRLIGSQGKGLSYSG